MNKSRKIPTLLLLFAALLLAGCGTTATASATSPTSSAPATSQAPAYTPPPEPTPTPTPSPSLSISKFGDTVTWVDKLAVAVKPVGAGTVSSSGLGATTSGGALYMFDVTLSNGTSDLYDPTMLTISTVYGSSGTQASEVFDSAQNLGTPFSGKILPGKAQTVRMAFAIPPEGLSDVTMTVTPDFSRKDAIFTGGLQ